MRETGATRPTVLETLMLTCGRSKLISLFISCGLTASIRDEVAHQLPLGCLGSLFDGMQIYADYSQKLFIHPV